MPITWRKFYKDHPIPGVTYLSRVLPVVYRGENGDLGVTVCAHCGCIVFNEYVHTQWHNAIEDPDNVAARSADWYHRVGSGHVDVRVRDAALVLYETLETKVTTLIESSFDRVVDTIVHTVTDRLGGALKSRDKNYRRSS